MKEMFSVIIPTMWRCNDLFQAMLYRYVIHPLIDEVLIINNDTKETPEWSILSHSKIKILNQPENIKVNPAWNLGVEHSINKKLCIANDDIFYDTNIFDTMYKHTTEDFGVFGLSHSKKDNSEVRIIEWDESMGCVGQIMFLHRNNWITIPNELVISYGDDFIFNFNKSRKLKNYVIENLEWTSPFGSTTRDTTITSQHANSDKQAWNNIKHQFFKETENKKMKKILIAIPTAKYIEPETFKSIYDLEVPDGYETEFQFFYGYTVSQIRNLIAEWSKHYDYLFAVDSDIAFPKHTLKNFISADKDIISGLYIQRIPDTHTLEVYMDTPDGGCTNIPYELIKDRGIVEVAGCGFGCVLVKGEVFKKIPYPHFVYREALKHSDTVSEDIDFCMKARKAGFKIWADSSIQCEHIGNTKFLVDKK